ncbi:MAG: Gfo/Idh/MocA family oxidoreductase [Fimbriimonadaceae bacterium]|nr:Gfo/Idh/MocA family oxidoreductase [Fimbriimonadaceae bacterium]
MSRRDFMAASAAAGVLMASPHSFAHAQGSGQIKVGLIGCGGRGTGAAANAVAASPDVVIHAMGDIFRDKIEGSRNWLKETVKEKFQVTEDRMFLGFDSYKKVIASGVDYIILASPPGFRPDHFRAAIEAGKHVFFEKPVATDVWGVKEIMAASDLAKQKGLGVAAGTQRRHDLAYRECINRIHDGQIGDVLSLCAYWNQGGLWFNVRQPQWSDLEYQLRNWLYYTYLSADMIAEQHIHNIDVCNWAKNAVPVSAVSLGGRQVRTAEIFGHIYDHFATEYTYADGTKMHSYCRQQDGTKSAVWEHIIGSKGKSDANNWINGENAWRWDRDASRPNPYELEHKNLIDSIKAGNPINEGRTVAEATMTAIMGRVAAYTGQEVKWDDLMKMDQRTFPETFAFGMKVPVKDVAMPGKTPLPG